MGGKEEQRGKEREKKTIASPPNPHILHTLPLRSSTAVTGLPGKLIYGKRRRKRRRKKIYKCSLFSRSGRSGGQGEVEFFDNCQ